MRKGGRQTGASPPHLVVTPPGTRLLSLLGWTRVGLFQNLSCWAAASRSCPLSGIETSPTWVSSLSHPWPRSRCGSSQAEEMNDRCSWAPRRAEAFWAQVPQSLDLLRHSRTTSALRLPQFTFFRQLPCSCAMFVEMSVQPNACQAGARPFFPESRLLEGARETPGGSSALPSCSSSACVPGGTCRRLLSLLAREESC